MDLNFSQFVEEYFINPVVERTGYNIVNTLVYAIIAIVCVFIIYRVLKKNFDRKFIYYIIPFVLLGSTIRVITDSIDSGIAQNYISNPLIAAVVNSQIYNYGFATATPGIYIITAALTLTLLLLLKKSKAFAIAGIILWASHFIVLIPMFKHFHFFALLIAIAIACAVVGILAIRRYIRNVQSKLAIFAHSLDGASTFIAVDVFNRFAQECLELKRCYTEQHVVARTLEALGLGAIPFLFLKLLFATVACAIIERECKDENEKNFIYLIIIILGLAPGVRNTLRILVGA